jgi:hypothetical protein
MSSRTSGSLGGVVVGWLGAGQALGRRGKSSSKAEDPVREWVGASFFELPGDAT